MNMKNTVILLIFLLSILGLIMGVYFTEDVNSAITQDNNSDSINNDSNSILTFNLTDNENNVLTGFFG
ncbi:hypothetical protein [uncultured Methanobrevibacter sp.]|uniref:hypothetical protein n=1 Tax=uncultured Methanobrevibacter sp. TaxID=253161 RepID=UPI0025DC5561|nr:hypothetical protein [uncultured Methanobrevibacter sp.]